MRHTKRCLPVVALAIIVTVLAIVRERRISALEAKFAARSRPQP